MKGFFLFLLPLFILFSCSNISNTTENKKRRSKKDSSRSKKEENKDGYVENIGKRTGNTIKDTGMLAGSFLGLGRDKKDTNSNE